MQSLDGVVFGGPIATTLLGEDVNDLRATGHRCGVTECFFKKRNVMSVEGAGIANTECLKERRWFECFANCSFCCVEACLGDVANDGKVSKDFFKLRLAAHVHRVVADLDETLAKPGDGWRIRAAVVVENDDAVAARVAEVIETFERHAASH